MKDDYREQIKEACERFISAINRIQERNENLKKNIIDNAPEIPFNRVKESEKSKNDYCIYCKDIFREYIVIFPKDNLLKIEDNFYYVDASGEIPRLFRSTNIYSGWGTLVLSRYLGDKGKFIKEFKIDISEFFPSRNTKKNEIKKKENGIRIEKTPNDKDLEEKRYDEDLEEECDFEL